MGKSREIDPRCGGVADSLGDKDAQPFQKQPVSVFRAPVKVRSPSCYLEVSVKQEWCTGGDASRKEQMKRSRSVGRLYPVGHGGVQAQRNARNDFPL
jgi:hypothetical protein